MNILFLTRLFSPHIGGVEKHVEKISLELIKRNHQVTILTSQHDSSLQLLENLNQIQIIRIPHNKLSSKLQLWKWIFTNRQLFQQADIIHIHDVFWWYLPLRLMLKKPVYTTFHGWEGIFPPSFKAKMWRKLAEKLSTKTICVGDYIAKWYGAKPDLVTYGATDQSPLLVGKDNHITVLGRLSADNDIDIIAEAIKIIKLKNPHLQVNFLGDGPLAFVAASVGEVMGFVQQPAKFIEESRWVIASSYLSILDSMAAGKRVFSVYSNPLKKDYLTLHPAAKYFSTHYTPKSLASELELHLLHPNLSMDKIIAAQQWAQAQTWSKLASQYEKLWSIRDT